jgi:nucleoside-diphosphate-sugar epimerase
MTDLPRLVITGASGFVGRHLVAAFQDRAHIHGIARRSPEQCGIAAHPNLSWTQADIGDEGQVARAFEQVAPRGGADALVHLAAYFDYGGEEHDDYWRTNVQGLRHVLDQCVAHRVRHVVFASSVAACAIPAPGQAITEATAPLGEHVYARSKRAGEDMLTEFARSFDVTIVRIAALFSDWCEYPPLYSLLRTWLSRSWDRRILAGRGRTAVPFLHVHDLVAFMTRVLEGFERFGPCEVLLASPNGCVSHAELYRAALGAHIGDRDRHTPRETPAAPVLVPRALCRPGLVLRDLAGRVTGNRPLERPWMASYIDTEMRVDATSTHRRLHWAPTPSLSVVARLPVLLEKMTSDHARWERHNRAAIKLGGGPEAPALRYR